MSGREFTADSRKPRPKFDPEPCGNRRRPHDRLWRNSEQFDHLSNVRNAPLFGHPESYQPIISIRDRKLEKLVSPRVRGHMEISQHEEERARCAAAANSGTYGRGGLRLA